MKILNMGSLNIDYVYQVAHFVQPGETIASLELNKGCGGKGLNQSVALARAGARTAHAGCVGRDGLFLLQQLEAEGVDISDVRVTDAVSGHAIIQVDAAGQNAILLYPGTNHALTREDIAAALAGCAVTAMERIVPAAGCSGSGWLSSNAFCASVRALAAASTSA